MTERGGDDAALSELMPWAVRGIKPGRSWVLCADPEVLEERWRRLAEAAPERRAELFEPSRSRTPDSAVAALPGQGSSTRRLSREPGPRPPLVRVRNRAFDRLWLLADHRLLDQARPELWRVASPGRRYLLVLPAHPPAPAGTTGTGGATTPTTVVSAELPIDPRVTVHPLHRRPDGSEPNIAPGLLAFLDQTYGASTTPDDLLAWTTAVTARPDATRRGGDPLVPLPRSADVWAEGVALGRRLIDLHSDSGTARRLPDGRRAFVRRPVDRQPEALGYEAETETLLLGDGRLAPVLPAAVASPALGEWFADRTAFRAAPTGTLAALGLTVWPQRATTELLELATTLALLAGLLPAQRRLAATGGPWLTRDELVTAGVLPVPAAARRPASVFTCQEEGPEGQYALL